MATSPDQLRLGAMGEIRFVAEATEEGFVCMQPPGLLDVGYDVLVDAGNGILHRVQVKTISPSPRGLGNTYQFPLTRTQDGAAGCPLTEEHCDFVACFASAHKKWYIFPMAVVDRMGNSVTITVGKEKPPADYCKEAFHLMRNKKVDKRKLRRILNV